MTKKKNKKLDSIALAKQQRYVYLLNKIKDNQVLTKQELEELQELESDPKEKEKKKIIKRDFLSELIIKTQKEAALYAGCDERTIRRWVRNGMPVTKNGFYLKHILDHYKKTGGKDYNTEQHRQLKAGADIKEIKAKLLDFELKIKTKELLSAKEVEEGRIKRIHAVKRLLTALPRKMASKLAGKKTRQIQKKLNEEIDYILRTFSGDASEFTKDMD